jgi:hypothetical protein
MKRLPSEDAVWQLYVVTWTDKHGNKQETKTRSRDPAEARNMAGVRHYDEDVTVRIEKVSGDEKE